MELVSNGIRYGSRPGGWVTLIARRVGVELEIDVTDSGRTDDDEAPRLAAPPLGQGMRIVRALCASVDIEDRGGRHVRVVLAPQPPEIAEPEVSAEELLDTYLDDDALGGRDDAA
jgi:anti-sigma regulatory factor (Ser/Thr protein kinase)